MQLGSLVTRARRFPGLAVLFALAMLITQSFALPFPVHIASNEIALTTPATAQDSHRTCGDVASGYGHPVGSHSAACPSAADCAAMHGWVGASAQAVPVPAPLAASYPAPAMLSCADEAGGPPVPPPRFVV